MLVSQEVDKFVINDLDQLLSWRNSIEHFTTQRLFFNPIRKVFCYLIVDVRVQQSSPNLAHTFGDIQLIDASLST